MSSDLLKSKKSIMPSNYEHENNEYSDKNVDQKSI
jgi:hypothetical protein